MKIFDEAATREALPFDRLIERLREMFRVGCHVPPRHVHLVETEATRGTVLIMPAWTKRYLGIKTVNVFPSNAERGLPGLFSAYTLFDATTGRPLAQMDGNVITSRRTAAASALAASYLARADSKRLSVLGAGSVGSLIPQAYRAAFDLERVQVWDRTRARAEQIAHALALQGIDAVAGHDREQVVREADIVSTATLSTEPIVCGEWLAAGSHLDLIGGFKPDMREADDASFIGVRVFVDTDEALNKSGDLLGPLERGILAAGSIAGDLHGLCTQAVPGRKSDSERTVFKSVGTALEDLAAAIQVYDYWLGQKDQANNGRLPASDGRLLV